MGLTVVSPANAFPVTLEEAQRQARTNVIGAGDVDAEMFDGVWIPAAVARAETFQHRTYITTQFQATFDWCWPCPIWLPRAPVQSVDKIEYVDTDGVVQELAASEFQVDLSAEPARIFPAFGKMWPAVRNELAAVRVTFTAGYGDAPTDVPDQIRAAILIMVATMFAHREEVVVGSTTSEMPKAAENLLWPDRVWIPR